MAPAEEDDWDVCLSDFGLSAQKHRSELMTQLCGTPAYTGKQHCTDKVSSSLFRDACLETTSRWFCIMFGLRLITVGVNERLKIG